MPETQNTTQPIIDNKPVDPNQEEMRDIILKLRENKVPDERISAYLRHRFGTSDENSTSNGAEGAEGAQGATSEGDTEEKPVELTPLQTVNGVRGSLFLAGYSPPKDESPSVKVGAKSKQIPLTSLEEQVEKEEERVSSMREKFGDGDRRVLSASYDLKKKRQQLARRKSNPDNEEPVEIKEPKKLPKELEGLAITLKAQGKDDKFIQEVVDLWLLQDEGIIQEDRFVTPENLPLFNAPKDWSRPLNKRRVNYKLVEGPVLGFNAGEDGNIVPESPRSPIAEGVDRIGQLDTENLAGIGKASGNLFKWSDYANMTNEERAKWNKDYKDGKIKIPLYESVVRSTEQALNRLRTIDDRVDFSIGALIGDLGFTKGSYDYIKRNVKDLEESAEISGPTHQFTDIGSKGKSTGDNVLTGLGAFYNAVTSVGTSLVENRIPYLLAADMISQSVYDAAESKANAQGISVAELASFGNADLIEPVIIGTVSHQLEKIGLKGIDKYIKNLPPGLGQKILNLVYNGNTEGVTEILQGSLEHYNTVKSEALGRGLGQVEATKLAASAAGDWLLSRDSLESYLQGFVGSSAISGIGAATSRRKNTDAIEQNLGRQSEMKDIVANPNATTQDKDAANQTLNDLENKRDELIKEPYREVAHTDSGELTTLGDIQRDINALNFRATSIQNSNNYTESQKEVMLSQINEDIASKQLESDNLIKGTLIRTKNENKTRVEDTKEAIKLNDDLTKVNEKRDAIDAKEKELAAAEEPNPASTEKIKQDRAQLDIEEDEIRSQFELLNVQSRQHAENSETEEEAVSKVENDITEELAEIDRNPIKHINDKFPQYETQKKERERKKEEEKREKRRRKAVAKRKYKIFKTDDGYAVVDSQGVDAPASTKNSYIAQAIKEGDIDVTFGDDISDQGLTEEDYGPEGYLDAVESSNDPAEVADAIESFVAPESAERDYIEQFVLGKRVSEESFNRFGDRNHTTPVIKRYWFSKDNSTSSGIDIIAQEASELSGVEVTTEDVVDIIVNNPSNSLKPVQREEKADAIRILKGLKERFTELTGLPYSKAIGEAVSDLRDRKAGEGIVDLPLEVTQQQEKDAADFEKFTTIALKSAGKVVLTTKEQVNLALRNVHSRVANKKLNREYKNLIDYDGLDTYTTANLQDAYNIKESANKRGIDSWVVEKQGENTVVLSRPFESDGTSNTVDKYLERFEKWVQKKYDEAPKGGNLYSTILPIPSTRAFLRVTLDALKLVRKAFKKSSGIEKGIKAGFELVKNDLTETEWRTLVHEVATREYTLKREDFLNDFLGNLDSTIDNLVDRGSFTDHVEDFDFDAAIGNANLIPLDVNLKRDILTKIKNLRRPHHNTEYIPTLLKSISEQDALSSISNGLSSLYSEYNDILNEQERYTKAGRSRVAVTIGNPLVSGKFVSDQVSKIAGNKALIKANKDKIKGILKAEEQVTKDGILVKKFKPVPIELEDGSYFTFDYSSSKIPESTQTDLFGTETVVEGPLSKEDIELFDSFERSKTKDVEKELGEDKYPKYLEYIKGLYRGESDARFDLLVDNEADIKSLQNVLAKSIRNRAAFKLGMHYLNFLETQGFIELTYLGGYDPWKVTVLNESKVDKLIVAGRSLKGGKNDSSVPLDESPEYGDDFVLNGTPLITKASDWQKSQDLTSIKEVANKNGKVAIHRNTRFLKRILLVQNNKRYTMEGINIDPISKLSIQRQRTMTFIDYMNMGEGPKYLQTFFSSAGREFYSSNNINPQGTKLALAGMHLDKVALGRNGLFNLAAQVGSYAGAKGSAVDLAKHTMDNLSDYIEMYNNSSKDQSWLDSMDKPELWLDSIGELAAAMESGDPLSYETGIPIHFDASTSGAQQSSMLLEDVKSAETVNISLDKAFQDLYNKVGNNFLDTKITPLLSRDDIDDVRKKEREITDSLEEKYNSKIDAVNLNPKNASELEKSQKDEEKANKELSDYIKENSEYLEDSARIFASNNFADEIRDFAKSPVMISLYGAGAPAVASGLMKKFQLVPGFNQAYAEILAKDLMESVEMSSRALLGLLGNLRSVAKMAYSQKKRVRFIGPNGFPTEINPTIPLVDLVSSSTSKGKNTNGTVTVGSGRTNFGSLFKQMGPLTIQSTDPQMLSALTNSTNYPFLKTHDDVAVAAGNSGKLEVDVKTALVAPFEQMRTFDDNGTPTGNYLSNMITQILGEDQVKYIHNKTGGDIIRITKPDGDIEDIQLGTLDTTVAQYNEHPVSVGSTSNIDPGDMLGFVLPSEKALVDLLTDLGPEGAVDRVKKSATIFVKSYNNRPYDMDSKC